VDVALNGTVAASVTRAGAVKPARAKGSGDASKETSTMVRFDRSKYPPVLCCPVYKISAQLANALDEPAVTLNARSNNPPAPPPPSIAILTSRTELEVTMRPLAEVADALKEAETSEGVPKNDKAVGFDETPLLGAKVKTPPLPRQDV